MPDRYLRPSWFTQRVFNGVVASLTRVGVSVMGSRVLTVRGRRTGQERSVPVNLLTHAGQRYLVAPRGTTQWVRNLRDAGEGRLRVGRRVEEFSAEEIPDAEKPEVLRAYLRRWRFEVGTFFQGVGPKSSDEDLRRIAPDHPVFLVRSRP